jgi:hypothetical protein
VARNRPALHASGAEVAPLQTFWQDRTRYQGNVFSEESYSSRAT